MLSSRYLHLNEALGLGPMWLNRNAKIIHAAPQAAAAPVRPKTIVADTAQAVRTLSAGAHQARTAAIATAQTAKPAARVPEATPKAIAETPAKTEKAAHSDNTTACRSRGGGHPSAAKEFGEKSGHTHLSGSTDSHQ